MNRNTRNKLLSHVISLNHICHSNSFSLKRGESEFQAKWKWRNTLTSFIHSTLTGLWSIIIFVADPSFADDMINGYSKSGHLLISSKYYLLCI